MDRAQPAAPSTPSPDAEDFVRFCYRRRRVGWPELYDEMCHVATRGAFRGMGHAELAELGIGFSLFDTRQLADLVTRVVAEEQAERARLRAGIRLVRPAESAPEPTAVPVSRVPAPPAAPAEEPSATPPLVLAVSAGA
ncbi:MAG TPA: hypothetical protein VFK54_10725 [Candidatus Limnocylindrales bacterium]|nr:hypothetical protein [Candidatus Limnocylindrales bacterium]